MFECIFAINISIQIPLLVSFLFLYQTNTLSVKFRAQEREKFSVFPDFRTNASIGILSRNDHLMPARNMSIFEYSSFRTFVLTSKYPQHCQDLRKVIKQNNKLLVQATPLCNSFQNLNFRRRSGNYLQPCFVIREVRFTRLGCCVGKENYVVYIAFP